MSCERGKWAITAPLTSVEHSPRRANRPVKYPRILHMFSTNDRLVLCSMGMGIISNSFLCNSVSIVSFGDSAFTVPRVQCPSRISALGDHTSVREELSSNIPFKNLS